MINITKEIGAGYEAYLDQQIDADVTGTPILRRDTYPYVGGHTGIVDFAAGWQAALSAATEGPLRDGDVVSWDTDDITKPRITRAAGQATTLGDLSIDDINPPAHLYALVRAAWNHTLPELQVALNAAGQATEHAAGCASCRSVQNLMVACALCGRAAGQVIPEPPTGWKLVPIEPTNAMTDAGGHADDTDITCDANAELIYRAMFLAAPTLGDQG